MTQSHSPSQNSTFDKAVEQAETTQFFDTELFKAVDTFSEVSVKMKKLKRNMWPTEAGVTGHYIYDIDAGRLARYAGNPKEYAGKASNTASVLITHLAIRLHQALKSSATELPDITGIDSEELAVKQSELPSIVSAEAVGDINKAIGKIREVLGADFGDNPDTSIGGKLELVVNDMIADYREKKLVVEERNKRRIKGSSTNTLNSVIGGAAAGKLIGNNKTAAIGAGVGAVVSVISDAVDTNKSVGTNIKNVALEVVKNVKKEAPNMKTLKDTHKGFTDFMRDVGIKNKKVRNVAAITAEVAVAGVTAFKIIPFLWNTVLGAGGDIVTGAVKDKTTGKVKENPWKSTALAATIAAIAGGGYYFSDENQASLNREKREEAREKKKNGGVDGPLEKEVIRGYLVLNNYEETNEDDADFFKDEIFTSLIDNETLSIKNVDRIEEIFKNEEEFNGYDYTDVDIKIGSNVIKRRECDDGSIGYIFNSPDFVNKYYEVNVKTEKDKKTRTIYTFAEVDGGYRTVADYKI